MSFDTEAGLAVVGAVAGGFPDEEAFGATSDDVGALSRFAGALTGAFAVEDVSAADASADDAPADDDDDTRGRG